MIKRQGCGDFHDEALEICVTSTSIVSSKKWQHSGDVV